MTAILAKKVPLLVAGSFGNIFLRGSINNALMRLEVPQLVRRLRETFSDKAVSAGNKEIFEPKRIARALTRHGLLPRARRKRLSHVAPAESSFGM